MANVKTDSTLREGGWWQPAFLITMGIIFFTPFFRGLFFTGEQMTVLPLMAAAFFCTWMWKLSKNEWGILTDPMDILMLVFSLSYLVSFLLGPASKHLAAVQAAIGILLFMVYWTVSWLACDRARIHRILTVLYATTVAVALVGLGAALGVLEIRDGFVGTRIFTTFQYPNTAAAYLLGGLFLGLHLYSRATVRGRFVLSALQGILFVTFFGTQSRGALLILPVVLLVYGVLVPASRRVPLLALTLWSLFAGWIAYDPLVRAGRDGQTLVAAGWLLLVVALCLGFQFAWTRLERLDLGSRINRKLMTAGLTVVMVIAVSYMVLGFGVIDRVVQYLGTGGEVEAGQTLDREQRSALDLESNSAQERLYWMRESVDNIFLRNPLFGYGGGSWEASYRSFQDYPYASTRIHNSWLEILVDTGLLGFLSFAGVWVMLLWYTWSVWRSKERDDDKSLQASLTAAALALGGHSFLDFNFSLVAFTIWMVTLFGLTRALHRVETGAGYRFVRPKDMKEIRSWLLAGGLLVSLLAGGIGVAYHTSRSEGADAVAALRAENPTAAIRHFERASRFWPYGESVLFDLSSIHLNLGNIEEAQKTVDRLIAASPYYTRAYGNAYRIAWANDDVEGAIEATRTAVDKERWSVSLMEQMAEVHFFSSIVLVQEHDDLERAGEVLEGVRVLPVVIEEMNRQVDVINDTTLLTMSGRHYIDPTPSLLIYAGAAAYLADDPELALTYLEKANEDPDCPEDVYFWLALVYDELWMHEEHNHYFRLMQVSELANPNFSEQSYGFYQNLRV